MHGFIQDEFSLCENWMAEVRPAFNVIYNLPVYLDASGQSYMKWHDKFVFPESIQGFKQYRELPKKQYLNTGTLAMVEA